MAVENQIVMVFELPESACSGTVDLVEGWVSVDEDAHFLGDADANLTTMLQGIEGHIE